MSKKNRRKESWILNQVTYQNYLERLTNMALNIFEWKNLPDTVNERFLEQTLFNEGKVIFANDPTLGYIVAPVTLSGMVNHYGEPTQYHAVSTNYDRMFKPDNAVVIYNNYLKTGNLSVIEGYATRLYTVERTMDVNIQSQRTPVVILTDESQRLTLENLYMDYEGNIPFIFGNKGLDIEAFKVLKTDSPYVSDKLMVYKHAIWNEAMTFLGISNANQEKKERLVESEVSANEDQVEVARYVMMNTRKEACKKINNMYGLNVDVVFRLQEKERMAEQTDNLKEGNVNGI